MIGAWSCRGARSIRRPMRSSSPKRTIHTFRSPRGPHVSTSTSVSFHPFADGNARAARLALDFVVTAAGLILRVGPPLFALSRGADDPTGLVSLERVVDHCLGTRLLDSNG
jgi:hypothetical protein